MANNKVYSTKNHDDMEITTVNPDEVDALLARELNAMSFDERETLYEEIHGVEGETQETVELLDEGLRRMECTLQGHPNRELLEKAEKINPRDFDRAFRLMFLRCEYFDPDKAALRLLLFLENKVKFFGEDALARPINLGDDFNEDDMAFLKSGILQTIPARDRSGRVVISDFNMNPSLPQPENVDSLIKTIVYIICAAAEDEETQKRGMVGIFYFTSALKTVQDLHARQARLFDWLPLKCVSGHFCYNDPRFRLVKAILMLVIGRQRRVRVRIHEGSHTECQYQLLTFGVPTSNFPVTYDGELKSTSHLKWVARRIAKEAAIKSVGSFGGIELPSLSDILLGRGKTIQEHGGNVLMRNLVAAYMPEYKRTPKVEKGQVVLKVMQALKSTGGRFLKRDKSDWWMEVSDEKAREKISMAFRTTTSKVLPTVLPTEPTQDRVNGSSTISQMTERDLKRARYHDSGSDEKPFESSLSCFGLSKIVQLPRNR